MHIVDDFCEQLKRDKSRYTLMLDGVLLTVTVDFGIYYVDSIENYKYMERWHSLGVSEVELSNRRELSYSEDLINTPSTTETNDSFYL